MIPPVPWWSAGALALVLGVIAMPIELRTGQIPNWLTLSTLTLALGAGFVDKHVALHIGGFVLAAVVTLALYRNDLLGGGGVKWTCALGTLVGLKAAAIMLGVGAAGALVLYAISRLRRRDFYFASSPLSWLGVAASLAQGFLAQL